MQTKDLQPVKRAMRAALFFLLLSVVGMTKMYAYDFSAVCETGQTLYYNITDAENHYVELTCPGVLGINGWVGYEMPTGNIILPSYVYDSNNNQYCVTSVGNYAFYHCNGMTGSLAIPNTITLIGKDAFCLCSGFTGSLTIPNSVTSINYGAFYCCDGFTGNLIIPDSVTEISPYAFGYCRSFSGDLVIPGTVTSVGEHAFFVCDGFTGSLVIPNSVITIGDYAFTSCHKLTGSLVIPNSVTTIGKYAFDNCYGFTGPLNIPSSVISLGDGSFRDCSSFTGDLVIPNSVTKIGGGTFSGCIGFTGNLVIPNSVTLIGGNAFNGCYNLSGSLVIPNSVTSIGGSAFYGCSGFSGNLVIPNSVTTIGNYAFDSCIGFMGSLTIGDSVTSIGSRAFADCNGLTGDLVIPNSVTELSSYAFLGCSGFTGNLTIGNSVASIGTRTFYNCSGFTGSLTLGSSLTTIGNSAFYGCSGLTGSLTIPDSVTSIGIQAFYGCRGFNGSLTIPNSVTSIGNYAFKGCSGLTEAILFETIPPTLGNSAFDGSTFPIYVSYQSLNDYKTATNWSNYQSRIFPMTYTTISGYNEGGGWAFIASPLAENKNPTTVDNMLSGTNYDLYQYDQSATDEEWQNYKVDSFDLVNGKGYVYANEAEVNVVFKGTFNEDETKVISLEYDAEIGNAGWNLVGNPFAVTAYIDRDFYVMNDDGSEIVPADRDYIEPMEGVFVVAESDGEILTFSTTAPSKSPRLVLDLSGGPSTGSGTAVVDRAIVRFAEGRTLPKLQIKGSSSKLFIQQDGKDYAVVNSGEEGEILVGFKAEQSGSYTLSFSSENVEFSYLHLVDCFTGADIDLLSTSSYSFNAMTTDKADRFKVVFTVERKE